MVDSAEVGNHEVEEMPVLEADFKEAVIKKEEVSVEDSGATVSTPTAVTEEVSDEDAEGLGMAQHLTMDKQDHTIKEYTNCPRRRQLHHPQ